MKKTLLATAAVLALTGIVHAESTNPNDDVMELAIRAVPDQEAWKAAAGPFGALLAKESGIIATAEFMSIMGFAPMDANGQPVKNVFIGMLQIDDDATHDALMSKYFGADKPAEVTAYLGTIENIGDAGKLRPFRDTPALDVANMVQPGQVLEIAVRDVSGWDFGDFDAKRKAFVDVLTSQKGVVREFEYRSIDGKYYVGMTLYESGDALQAIAANPAVTQGPEFGALMAKYPPMVAQYTVRIQ
jgi:hypothetical protein